MSQHGTSSTVQVVNLNSTREDRSGMDPAIRDLLTRREAVLGAPYRLQYADPFLPVRAQGSSITDVHGNEYLDAFNNVPSVGHNHPRVVEAVASQLSRINTNTRYLQEDIVEYAEKLVATHDPSLANVMFTCTGSEANDVAMRIARAATGGTGILVSDYAYHGGTDYVSSWSPSLGQSTPIAPDVRTLPAPDRFRHPDVEWSSALADEAQKQIDDLKRHGYGFAAFIVDGLFSSDGIYPASDGLLRKVVDVVHAAGGVVISDEVQPGFGRTADAMWGYQSFGFTPDIITMGKPMGNGMPIAGIVARRDLMDTFAERSSYFNTFGGENAPVAAANAVLGVIRDEDLLANARIRAQQLKAGFVDVITRHGVPAEFRAAGMYLGVEFVEDLDEKVPATQTTLAVVNGLRDRRVLTSTAGKYGNVIKMRPALTFGQADVDRLLTEFEHVIEHLPAPAAIDSTDFPQDELRKIVMEELRGYLATSGA